MRVNRSLTLISRSRFRHNVEGAALALPANTKHVQMPEPTPQSNADPALAALGADATRLCASRLARVAGTHALSLDGIVLPTPSVAGIGCWTGLRPVAGTDTWRGAVHASLAALPFEDEAFCAVLVRFVRDLDLVATAVELARVLAPHGSLLVADLHPRSIWHGGASPGAWVRALRAAGLDVAPVVRCGSPWPRARGDAGVPRWLVHGIGGAWLLEARRRTFAAIPLRKPASNRRAVEHSTLLPGAHRQCA